jgi:hypothetical protein
MTMENEKIPRETPEVLLLSAATFTPKMLALASLGVAILLLACTTLHIFLRLELICI